MTRWLILLSLTAAVVILAAFWWPTDRALPPEPAADATVVLFDCRKVLIAHDALPCTEDVRGPGTLTLSFRPDPPQTSWEVAVTGLAALAEACEFEGSYDETRLTTLQGRGETAIRCAIGPGVDRPYHEIRVADRTGVSGFSLAVAITFER